MMPKTSKKQICNIDVEKFLCLPANVYWLNQDYILQKCNIHTANLLGLACDGCIGLSYDDMANCANWTEGQAYSMWNDDIEVMSTEQAKSGVFEPPVPGPDGVLRYYLTTRSPLHNQDGKIVGVFGISIDITNSYLKQKNFVKNLQSDIEYSKKNQKNLSNRQSQCLYHLVRGLTAKQIAND